MAPLAATLAATVAVGVGVAIARGERERRAATKRRLRGRRFALRTGEPVLAAVRRAALGQLDLAIELLDGTGRELAPERTLHELRKALKRLRALVRLLRDQLGEQAFARENALLRDTGRRLSGARDAEVMQKTLEDLLRRSSKKLARRDGVRRLQERLSAQRDGAAEATLADGPTRARVLGDLRQLRMRIASEWPGVGGIEAIEPALERIYRQGRQRRRGAMRGSGDRTRRMHEWRKRVKDLRYASELLSARGVARRADALGELLGEEHDLAVLAARVRAEDERIIKGSQRKRLLKAVATRRRQLRRRALRDGERLYGRPPKKFVRRVRRALERSSLSRR